jgi:hypothetical protein
MTKKGRGSKTPNPFFLQMLREGTRLSYQFINFSEKTLVGIARVSGLLTAAQLAEFKKKNLFRKTVVLSQLLFTWDLIHRDDVAALYSSRAALCDAFNDRVPLWDIRERVFAVGFWPVGVGYDKRHLVELTAISPLLDWMEEKDHVGWQYNEFWPDTAKRSKEQLQSRFDYEHVWSSPAFDIWRKKGSDYLKKYLKKDESVVYIDELGQ